MTCNGAQHLKLAEDSNFLASALPNRFKVKNWEKNMVLCMMLVEEQDAKNVVWDLRPFVKKLEENKAFG